MDDNAFKGRIEQSVIDIRGDIVELKATLNVLFDKLDQRYVTKEMHGLLEKVVVEQGEEIEQMKRWRIYVQGGWVVIATLIALFSDQIRSIFFKH